MKKVLLLLAAMMLAGTTAVGATGERPVCPAGGDCKPKVLDVEIDVLVCGDPRMWARLENTGNVDTRVRWIFRSGNKAKGAPKRVVTKSLPYGVTKVLGPRWVLAKGARVFFRVYDPAEQNWFTRLKFRNRGSTAWGRGDCPENRFGEPTWENPRYSTR